MMNRNQAAKASIKQRLWELESEDQKWREELNLARWNRLPPGAKKVERLSRNRGQGIAAKVKRCPVLRKRAPQ